MAQTSFTGRLSKDAEIRYTPDGKAVANLNIAENHSRYNKQTDEWENTGTTWRRVALFGKRAEALTDLKKGTVVTVTGREETREYTTKDGTKGSSLEVTADFIGIVPTPQNNGGGYNGGQTPAQAQHNAQNQQWGGNIQPQGQGAPQGNQPPQGQPTDPWTQQGGGQYDWGAPAEDAPPF